MIMKDGIFDVCSLQNYEFLPLLLVRKMQRCVNYSDKQIRRPILFANGLVSTNIHKHFKKTIRR